MGEYISREATIDAIKKIYCPQCNNYNGAMCRACEHMDDMDIIEDMPAADVMPVKHGKWMLKENAILTGDECSLCKRSVSMLEAKFYKFCPYCGARMDGDPSNG